MSAPTNQSFRKSHGGKGNNYKNDDINTTDTVDTTTNEGNCQLRCGPCAYRKKNLKDCISPKSVTTHEVDTCLLSYKPRLIQVPSDKYPTLDSAVDCLEERKGGYVIVLKPGCHTLTKTICNTVDDLTIIGDCSPFVGTAFIHSCRDRRIDTPQADLELFCGSNVVSSHEKGEDPTGLGPSQLFISGRQITVQGARNPDFSSVCPGQKVVMILADGSLATTTILKSAGNTLTFAEMALSSPAVRGEGFFLVPNVAIVNNNIPVKISTSDSLIIHGVVLGIPGQYGSLGGFSLENCVVTAPIAIIQYYNFQSANVYLNFTRLASSSNGEALFQTFAGFNARLFGETISASSWKFSIFTSCRNGCTFENGSAVMLFGSDWINCLVGLLLRAQSFANVQTCYFCNNQHAIVAAYRSTFSSHYIEEPSPLTAVHFYDNKYAMHLALHCTAVIPNAIFVGNEKFATTGPNIHVLPENYPIGHEASDGSIIVQAENTGYIDELSAFEVPSNGLNSFFDCVQSLNAIVSYQAVVNPGSVPVNNCMVANNPNQSGLNTTPVGNVTNNSFVFRDLLATIGAQAGNNGTGAGLGAGGTGLGLGVGGTGGAAGGIANGIGG